VGPPAALIFDKRDVIGAWIVCLAIALAFFGYPAANNLSRMSGSRGVTRRESEDTFNSILSVDPFRIHEREVVKCCAPMAIPNCAPSIR
jgi:hypothetical protein